MLLPSHVPTFTFEPFTDPNHARVAENVAKLVLAKPIPETPVEARSWLEQSGLFTHLVPSLEHGTTLSVTNLCVLRETLGYVSPLADSMFAVHGLGSFAILQTKDFSGRDEFLQRVRAGTSLGAFALTEPEAGSDVGNLQLRATPQEGGGFRLFGEKHLISNAGIADHYMVFANANPNAGKKGISCFVVGKNSPGLIIEPMQLTGNHPIGKLTFRDCYVPQTALIGEVGHGLRLALATLDTFRTSVGAAACGMAARALDEALSWVRRRKQFGVPLAELPLVQAKIAQMATDLAAARAMVYRAAYEKDRCQSARVEVAMAKWFATEAAQRVIDSAVQLHGGSGVLAGAVVEELYREIRPLRIYEGTSEIQSVIIGSALCATPRT
jgi:acyl-CoA dehydrogenase